MSNITGIGPTPLPSNLGKADDRFRLPSASGMLDYILCPGKFNKETEIAPTVTAHQRDKEKYAAYGDLVHRALADDLQPGDILSSEQADTFETCNRIANNLKERYGPFQKEVSEERLWYYGADGLKGFSGRYDRAYISKTCALVLDFKTLFGDHEEAPDNKQLMTLALLVARNYFIDQVYVALIQPWKTGQFTVSEYNKESLDLAEIEISRILDGVRDPDAKRIPGEHQCKYCKAYNYCPEAIEAGGTAVVTLAKQDPDFSLVDSETLGRFLAEIGKAEQFIDKLRKEARDRLTRDSNSVPGWMLKPGRFRRNVKDPRQAYNLIADTVKADEFAECCTVAIGKLEEVYIQGRERKVGPTLSKAAAIRELEARISPALELNQTIPILTKAPPRLKMQ